MSTKTLEWLVGARDGKKLGSGWDPENSIPTLFQPGQFQTFALYWFKFFCNIGGGWFNFAYWWSCIREGLLLTGLV